MDHASKLEAASITDWHLNLGEPGKTVVFPGPVRVKESLLPYAESLAAAVSAEAAKRGGHRDDGFNLVHETTIFRAQYMGTSAGSERYALRAQPEEVLDLTSLGFKEYHQRQLTDPDLKTRGGMVLISGSAGSGKTTTASSLVKALLHKYGGYCLTAEDPPEQPLDGFHGDGYCEQTEIEGDSPHAHFRKLLRCFPAGANAILFFGEIRDAKSASELLRIAVDGHLIIATIHSGDCIEALQRLLAMASLDGEQEAKALLSKSLRLVLHQRLDSGVLQVSSLPADETVAAIIKQGKLGNLLDCVKLSERKAAAPTSFNP